MPERLICEEARALIGPADDATLTDILSLGVDRAELIEALSWIANDRATLNEGRAAPRGRFARVGELLQAHDEEPAAGDIR